VEHGPPIRLIVGCIADLVARDVKVVVQEQPKLAGMVGQVGQLEAPDEQAFMEIYGVLNGKLDLQPRMFQVNLSNQIRPFVNEMSLPFGIIEPLEITLRPDANSKWVPHSVVFEANMGPVEISNLVGLVEGDQQIAVAKGEIARHGSS
jgi:hypothetical protein